MIVPKHDLVWRKFRVVATADQCKDIASEKHLYNADATLEISSELVLERLGVEYSEASLGACGEAALILVKVDVDDLVFFTLGAICDLWR